MIRTRQPHSHKLNQLHQAAQACGLPWVSYRLPGEAAPVTLIQLDEQPGVFDRQSAAGFVIAPFDFPEKQGYWLKNDLELFGFDPDMQFARTGRLQAKELIRLTALHDALAKMEQDSMDMDYSPTSSVTQPEYEAQINAALEAISSGILEKVVLSRTNAVDLEEGFQPVHLFEALCRLYPAAFVSLYQLPGRGCWIGASPELLLSKNGEQFESMSLAGTATRLTDEPHWQSKEQHEQQVVTRYIVEQLEACGMHVSIGEQETIQAGQVFHLRNRIIANGRVAVYDVVRQLHPTPAVCGYPLAAARQFIREHEKHDREFYAGFLGPVTETGDARLFVNLRAARLAKKHALLYLGGGIVQGSDPAAEWAETQAKAATLLAAIHHAGITA